MMNLRIASAWALLLVFSIVGVSLSVAEEVEGRAIWVTRFEYKTPSDVRKIIENCKQYHFNQILFQVRGNGTVFYNSEIEPWAWELTSDSPATTGKNPGWDPLQVAIEEAHKGPNPIQLHAYMNVFPGWRGQKYPPPEAKQLWTEHPDWFMVDEKGNKMIPRDHDVDPKVCTWYSFISPGIPAVQDYVVRVFLEVVNKYNVDGIHFDYVRYPHEIGDYSYDPISVERFTKLCGKPPKELPAQWNYWRSAQVTEVVRRIYREGKKINPKLIVSASVFRDYQRAGSTVMQRSQEWLEEGIIDLVIPMIYTSDLRIVKRNAADFAKHSYGRLTYSGLSASTSRRAGLPSRLFGQVFGLSAARNPSLLFKEMCEAKKAGANGVCLFSYSALFKDHLPNDRAAALLRGPFKNSASPPPITW
jgi:uncharacterized lipoprotein YddW (UPF0748 family)